MFAFKGFSDLGEMWRESYDTNKFEDDLKRLWEDISPLYQYLHAYVRIKLRSVYGNRIRQDGPLPAHLLGSVQF